MPLPPILRLSFAWGVFVICLCYANIRDPLRGSALSVLLLVAVLVVVYGAVMPTLLRGGAVIDGKSFAPWLQSASICTALSGAAFSLGFAVPRPDRRPDLSVEVVRIRMPRLIAVLLLISTCLFLYVLLRYGFRLERAGVGPLSGPSAYVLYAPQYLTGVSLATLWLEESRVLRIWAAAGLLITGVYFFDAFIRYTFVVLLLSCAILCMWRLRKSLYVPRLLLVPASIALFVLLGLLGQRRSLTYQGTVGSSVVTSARSSLDIVSPLAALLSPVGRSERLNGASYAYVAEQLVPRALWPAKPLPPILRITAPFASPSEGRAVPTWGEMYANFGWAGVLVGMWLSGMVGALLMRGWLRRRKYDPCLDVAAALMISLVVQWISRGYLVQTIYNAYGFLIGPVVILVACARRTRLAALTR